MAYQDAIQVLLFFLVRFPRIAPKAPLHPNRKENTSRSFPGANTSFLNTHNAVVQRLKHSGVTFALAKGMTLCFGPFVTDR